MYKKKIIKKNKFKNRQSYKAQTNPEICEAFYGKHHIFTHIHQDIITENINASTEYTSESFIVNWL